MAVVHNYPALARPAQPTCSVCIANYNGEQLLVDCIESLLTQAGAIGFEIIVHDDASSDGSVTLLRERYPQVELLASADNVGFCISNNRMVAHARGEYVLLLNNDAALFPDALATLHRHAREQVDACILTLPQYDWESAALVDRGCLLDPFYNPLPNLDQERTEVAMVIGACLWIPRDAWKELGGFPEWMESIGEDLYLCCMARSRGLGVHTVPGSGFRHRLGTSFGGARVHENSLNTTFRRRRLSERNKTFALVIFTPTPAMWLLLALHLAAILGEGAVISLLRRDDRIFCDIYAAVPVALLRHWKTLSRRRRQVQEARTISVRQFYSAFSAVPRKLALLWRFGVPRIT